MSVVSAITAIAQYLEDSGIGVVGQDVFKSRYQQEVNEMPVKAAFIYPHGGLPPEWVFNDAYKIYRQNIEITVRAPHNEYTDGLEFADNVLKTLDGATIPGVLLIQASESAPRVRGLTKNGHYLYLLRFRVQQKII